MKWYSLAENGVPKEIKVTRDDVFAVHGNPLFYHSPSRTSKPDECNWFYEFPELPISTWYQDKIQAVYFN